MAKWERVGQASGCSGPGAPVVLRRHSCHTEGDSHQPLRSSLLRRGPGPEYNARVLRVNSAQGRPEELATRLPRIAYSGVWGVTPQGVSVASATVCYLARDTSRAPGNAFAFALGIFVFGFVLGFFVFAFRFWVPPSKG